jgi:hypothetical protein
MAALSVPDHWTDDEVRTRFNVREQAPAFQDGSLSAAQEQVLIDGWARQEEVALWVLRAKGDDPEAQAMVKSLYEGAFHFTAFIAPS